MPAPPTPEVGERQLQLVGRLLRPTPDTELEGRLARLGVPTLVVFGTEDGITPPELGDSYVDLMPEAFLALVYDAGHAVEYERPEALVELVADFLLRGAAFTVAQTSSQIFP
jgi:pimeloyl-ACP methyl ester carboxylesterase